MSTYKTPGDNACKVWNHEFTWTDKHFTPEELLPLKQQTDDLAIDAVSRLQAISVKNQQSNMVQCFGRFDVYSVLKEHHEDDSVLRELWEEINTVPEWVDWTQIERGQDFLYRYFIPNITGLTLQGFLGGTAVSNPSDILIYLSIRMIFNHVTIDPWYLLHVCVTVYSFLCSFSYLFSPFSTYYLLGR